jgi:hypothetical protein
MFKNIVNTNLMYKNILNKNLMFKNILMFKKNKFKL